MFNGEIYNFEELNRQFLSSGHSFKTRSDTETIVHLYEELGEACFAELRGMFSLALWDARKKQLVLARDRVGKKPLFYSWDGRRLLFGSEIKALFPAGGVSKAMDLEALSDYFSYQYVPAPKTIYESVRKLRPAHYLVADASGIRESAVLGYSIRPDTPAIRSCSGARRCSRSIEWPSNRVSSARCRSAPSSAAASIRRRSSR